MTYVGELGWELYPPTEFAVRLWDTMLEAGAPHGLVPAGYRAIDSLRLEKGYRSWGADITPDDSPLEAGLGFAVAFDKDADSSGATPCAGSATRASPGISGASRSRTRGPPRSGTSPSASATRSSPAITSGGIGYAVGKSIAFAYLPAGLDEVGTKVAIEVFGEWVDAEVVDEPLWDPAGEGGSGV